MHADDKFGIMAFKKQLSLFGLSHVALAVFGAIFGTQLQNGGKVDFNDAFDPQAALALCTLYSKVLEKASKFKKVCFYAIKLLFYLGQSRNLCGACF
jgi:hypothetical protein